MYKLRFGVIGTNFITDWILKGAAQDPRFELTAVYSRSQETASRFAETYNITRTFTSLEEMASCADIDAVYIASPNALHASQSILMMQHGKHVLCEKPLASTAGEAKRMTEVARTNGVVLMEAMKTTLTPHFRTVLDHLPRIGKVRQYVASFCQYSSRYDRYKAGELINAFNPQLSSGALLDVGIYTLYPLVVMYGKPLAIKASATLLDTGVDGAGTVILDYEGCTATLIYSKISDAYLPTEIRGEEGTLTIDRINSIQSVHFKPRKFSGSGIGPSSEAELLSSPAAFDEHYYELKEFMDLIQNGMQESAINSWKNSITTLEIMDEIRRQIGVTYPADRS